MTWHDSYDDDRGDDLAYLNRLPANAPFCFGEFSAEILLVLSRGLLLAGRLTLADAEHLMLNQQSIAATEFEIREHLGLLVDLHVASRHIERTAKRARPVWLSTIRSG